jgi:ATP-dependent DNA helicase RecG
VGPRTTVGLDAPLSRVVGRSAVKLERHLGLRTVEDLLRHYPRRWARRGELTDLRDLRPGEFATIYARIESVSFHAIRKGLTKTDVVVTDGRTRLTLPFFNLKQFQRAGFTVGRTAFFAGKVDTFRRRPQLAHPEVEFVDEFDGPSGDFAAAIVPIYPASHQISTMKIRRCVQLVLDVVELPDDPLPPAVRDRLGLIGLRAAFDGIHRPASYEQRDAARKRLAFDEAFVLQVAMARRRAQLTGSPATPRAAVAGRLLDAFDARLPFRLTAGQVAVGATIAEELARSHPMHRLLQGEVGSGKTVVALRAMLAVVDAGGQAALLAPTEVLAQQHFASINTLLGPLALGGRLGGAEHATGVALLTGSMSQAARRAALLQAASGEAGIVVGTHALLQENVQFADLGLVVVDEQHRFGVEQRDALRAKAGEQRRPHVLVMTATPIPRTIAMTVYGDLDVSTLHELPAGRSAIATHVAPVAEKPGWQARVWQRVREEVDAGHQVFVVCPRIGGDNAADTNDADGTDDLDVPATGADEAAGEGSEGEQWPVRPPLAVIDVAAQLSTNELADLRLAMLHGRMPAEEKEATMRAFAGGDLDVLVATTVIEVGVDVPNATVMVVLDADRFGISQLHQLRGRVGRGSAPGLCLLVTEAPPGTPARARLDALAATSDGFALAELDLEQRREGTILGEQQHGRSDHKHLSLLSDRDLIEQARDAAADIVAADPDLAGRPALRATVDRLTSAVDVGYLEKA